MACTQMSSAMRIAALLSVVTTSTAELCDKVFFAAGPISGKDPAGTHKYHRKDIMSTVWETTSTGEGLETVIADKGSAWGVTVNPNLELVYWTEWDNGRIFACPYDNCTNNKQTIIGGGGSDGSGDRSLVEHPSAIKYDGVADKLMFIDQGTNTLYQSSLWGANMKEVTRAIPDMVDFDLSTEGYRFVSSAKNESIWIFEVSLLSIPVPLPPH